MKLIEAMTKIADKYHNQIVRQKRKYTGEKYTVHTDEVENICSQVEPDNETLRAAAKGHDLLEDTPITIVTLKEELKTLGVEANEEQIDKMIGFIVELTDVYTKEKYPQFNRAQRKELESKRLSLISKESATIKLADFLSNTNSIVEHDKEFALVYIREKIQALPHLAHGNPTLLNRVAWQTVGACKKLGVEIPVISR